MAIVPEHDLPESHIVPEHDFPEKTEPIEKEPSYLDKVSKRLELVGKYDPPALALKGIGKLMEGYDVATQKLGDVAFESSKALGASPEVSSAVGAGVYTAGQMAGGGGIGKEAIKLTASAAKELMKTSLKATVKQINSGELEHAAKLLIDNGISVSKSGLSKIQSKIDELNKAIDMEITSSVNKNKPIDIERIKKYVGEVKKKFLSGDFIEDQGAIANIESQLANHPFMQKLNNLETMTVKDAQELKKMNHAKLSEYYGQSGNAKKDALKAQTRGIKEEIEKNVPAVAGMNKELSGYYKAMNMMEKRELDTYVKDPSKLSYIASNPKYAAASTIGKSAPFKSALALLLSSKKTGAISGAGYAGLTQTPYQQK